MARNILLVEVNEITWDLIDPLIAAGKLPTFARLKREGTWGTPVSVDLPPQLDPWITWTTLYTGRTQNEHNVFFLQQPPESIKARRMWEICADQGLSVGVYGSICSWPPRKVNGFHVPDTFSPDATTYPASLEPIQQLNLTYTRTVRLPADQDTLGFKLKMAMQLTKLGLGPKAIAAIVKQLGSEVFDKSGRWRRVALQPMVNFQFFSKLYRKHRPRYASFHTNHVAHYQHTYWKAMQPDRFRPVETTDQERKIYGKAIEYGYETADRLLADMMALLDKDTVMVVASSMGQKPYISDLEGGKQIQQVHSREKLLEILGVTDHARTVSTMSDEFIINADSPAMRDHIYESLRNAWVGEPGKQVFNLEMVENAVRVNLHFYGVNEVKGSSPLCFPLAPGAPKMSYEDLIYNTGHLKSGCHDPRGMAIFYGAGVPRGVEMREYNNLDFAPTFLEILDLKRPAEMTGRVMREVTGALREPALAHA
ncbi:MAG TPA: alkaline phosphatase family protein [Bryobacteraceae bacterium]|nr:alkaline phosphatase family protein [Bryobacteraceae bacterium]